MGRRPTIVKGVTLNSYFRAKLEGCILGKNTRVGNKAELTRCVTQAAYEVGSGGKFYRKSILSPDVVRLRND